MKRSDVNRVAIEVYELIIGDRIEQEPWSKAPKSIKAFYRRLATWHLKALEVHEGQLQEVKRNLLGQIRAIIPQLDPEAAESPDAPEC